MVYIHLVCRLYRQVYIVHVSFSVKGHPPIVNMGYIFEGQIERAMFHDAMGEMEQDGTLSHDVMG